MRTFTKCGLVALLAFMSAACTVKDTEAPPLTGPSELGLRLHLSLTPDSILQDGFSQTVLNIEASGADGRPARGVTVRVEIVADGVAFDFGTLSAKTVVTGDDGRARVTYTAPPREIDGDGHLVTFLVTPIGDDFRAAVPRQVDLQLVQPGVILPPNGAPVPDFTFTPTSPKVQDVVNFDASLTRDEGVPCGQNCTYTWDFGDRTTGSGQFTTHQFRDVSNFQVRLTVTDRRGVSATIAKAIDVGAGTPPTASFTYSPSNPAVSQIIFFNASASTAAPGRRLVSYDWDFGSGRTASGVTVSKGYDTAGTYKVTLTVTDDAGQTTTISQDVNVGAAGTGPTATLIASPSTGSVTTNYFFDASGSRPGPSPIVEYRFTFGDGSPDVVGTSPTTTHRYPTAGAYTARVTIRDSAGRTATATTSVTVQ
jgi:PKD repeat protein